MLRTIIKIDETLCNGCGACIPGCPEGALQIIDGKARLVSDLFCDGLGACIGECPEGAISVEEREAEPYDEKRVIANVVKQGPGTIRAHLQHLRDHNETEYLLEALRYLELNGHTIPDGFNSGLNGPARTHLRMGCPGSMQREIQRNGEETAAGTDDIQSELTQWPVQLHLINPNAPYFRSADLLIAADCVPFALAGFHKKFLRGKKLFIFCPKLDKGIESYIEKLTELFGRREIRSITLVHMEVPCCFGLGRIVKEALMKAGVSIPVHDVTVSIGGDIV